MLKGVGYWSSPSDDIGLPDPTRLVDANWRVKQRPRIIAYLKSGITYANWRGLSYCRFRCGVNIRHLGNRCLTDGEWIWPEGLYHYLEVHQVRLPEEFVASMMERKWRIPSASAGMTRERGAEVDYSFWVARHPKQVARNERADCIAGGPGDPPQTQPPLLNSVAN
jgi:hypothetical protein